MDRGTAGDGPLKDGLPRGDGPAVKPDGPAVKPDGPAVKPDGPAVKPDGPVVKPDGPVVKPDAAKPSCAAMDAKGQGACAMILGVVWNGTACVSISGCSCAGSDCNKLFPNPKACQLAYAHCTKPPLKCTAWDAAGKGACALFLGYSWDGKKCVGISGCSCSGTDCGRLYTSLTACQSGQAGCVPPPVKCSAWAVQGVGNCKKLLGYYWDGKSCQALGGCSCAGADCAKLYPSSAACLKGQASCP